MSANIPQSVLSDALQQAINGRRVKAAVFLTFQFDPAFFEEEVLSQLFTQSFSHVAKVRLLQLEEALQAVDHVAVYYDRQGLGGDAQSARLDYRRIGLARSTGYFHPKNILLLVENQDKEWTWESLIFATLSANLTRSGWWENVEAVHFMEVGEGDACPYREDLLKLIARVKHEDRIKEEHPALEAIRAFLYPTKPASFRSKGGRWFSRVYAGQSSIADFLSEFIEPNAFNLEIISPYFDTDAGVLFNLIDVLQPKATRVFLPKDKYGVALCTSVYYDAVRERSHVGWGILPKELLSLGAGSDGTATRFVHAKVYRFWNQQREILFIGSVNLTGAAHSAGNAGNFETAILVEPEPKGSFTWWLKPEEGEPSTRFHPEEEEQVNTDVPVGDVAFRFDWSSGAFQYYWESRAEMLPGQALLDIQGVPIGAIGPIRFDEWVNLSDACAHEAKRLLTVTSFVWVRTDGADPFRILVREEQMAYKPSRLLSLSPDEILQYWSLLSPEQREVILLTKLLSLPGGSDVVDQVGAPLSQTDEPTLFDRFAGIFHGFNRLEAHLKGALTQKHEAEAIYLLFGQKFDSLPSLIDKIVQDKQGDRVNRYVSLLCARQLVTQVCVSFPDFQVRHDDEFQVLQRQMEAIDLVRAEFTFDSPFQREKFFTWFERMFSTRLASAEAET